MRKSNLKGILLMILGFIVGAIVAAVVVKVLPATLATYKTLIFFVVLITVGGIFSVIAGKISGR